VLAWRDGYYHEVEDARGMIRPVRSFPLSPNRPAMRSRGFVFISRRTRAVGGGGEWLEHLLEDITLLMHSSASSVSLRRVDVNRRLADRAVEGCLRGSGHTAPPFPERVHL
jgi:hypothetical protein